MPASRSWNSRGCFTWSNVPVHWCYEKAMPSYCLEGKFPTSKCVSFPIQYLLFMILFCKDLCFIWIGCSCFFVPTVVVVLNYQLATAVFALVTRWRVDWKWLPVRCCPKPETDSSDPTITANSSINWLISAELTGWIIETAVYIFRRLIRSVFPFPCEILWKEKKDEVVHSTASVSLYVYVYFNFFLFWFSLDVNNLLICLTTE